MLRPFTFILLLLTLATAATAQVSALAGKFGAYIYISPQGDTLRCRLIAPPTVQPGQVYPLLLFLHGAGERGTDNNAQLSIGVHQFVTQARRAAYPCYILVPQCPMRAKWSPTDMRIPQHTTLPEPQKPLALSIMAVDALIDSLPIDTNRVYAMGISLGGFGVLEAAIHRPNLFAAVVPISGGGDQRLAATVAHIPMWFFHGGADAVVPTAHTSRFVTALRAAGAQPQYTEYPGVNHNCWGTVFQTEAMYQWLFQQRRGPRP